ALHGDRLPCPRRAARVRPSRRARLPRPDALDGDAQLPAGVPPLLARARAVAARPADVVVVGGGLVGCAVARELARRGLHPALVERGELAGGARPAPARPGGPQAGGGGAGPPPHPAA